MGGQGILVPLRDTAQRTPLFIYQNKSDVVRRGALGGHKSWIGPSCGSVWRSIIAPDTTASNIPVKLLSGALETTCQYESLHRH